MEPTRRVVVDASVATKWHLTDEDDVDRARMLLRASGRGDLRLTAPRQIHYEVPNALVAATLGQRPRITPGLAEQAITEFLSLPIVLYDGPWLALDAFRLARTHGCAYYDALYVALAQRLVIPFVTADRRLFNRVSGLPGVTWLGDYRLARPSP